MAKKNQIKKIFESMPVESAEGNDEITSSTQAAQQSEETPSEPNPQEAAMETSPNEESLSSEEAPTSTNAEAEESSPEDLLEDVRRSLIEEETEESQKETKWWRRIGRKSKKAEAEPEKPPEHVEIDLPALSTPIDSIEAQDQKEAPEEPVDEIDELIDMLATGTEEAAVTTTETPEVEVPREPEPEIDFDELKKEAFRPPTDEESEKDSDVRSVALEDGEEVFVEVQAPVVDPLEERLRAFENALKPYRQYLNITLAFLGVVMAVIASLIIFNVYQRSRLQPVKEVSNLPYPTSVALPGGWIFNLGKGSLQDGKWEPNGAEWLEGTEVCRWVALPWSRQLEAVVRTLNPKDPIQLVMSNNDKLVYQVYSVRQLTPDEMQKLDSNSPCLLLILTQPGAEKRWVLTALP